MVRASRWNDWNTKPIVSLRSSAISGRRRASATSRPPMQQPAAGRPVQPAEQVHQRRLARAGRPDDRHVVAGGDRSSDTPRSAGTVTPSSSYVRVTSLAATRGRSPSSAAAGRRVPGRRRAPRSGRPSLDAVGDLHQVLARTRRRSPARRSALPSRTTQTASRPSALKTAAAGTATASPADAHRQVGHRAHPRPRRRRRRAPSA